MFFFFKGFFIFIFKTIALIVGLLVSVAFFTLAERKIIASIQRRRGPAFVGILGLLQPIADGLKLLTKETILPRNSNIYIFLISPILTFMLSVAGWAVIPFCDRGVLVDLENGLLLIFAVSSLGVYGIIMSGWASNSKYAFLGSLRSAAQMISYEVSLGLIVLSVLLCGGTLNLTKIVLMQSSVFYFIPLFPVCGLFFISALAETNRTPFDLPEAEAELVAGYNVEYSSMGFALFFLGEYSSILLMCALIVILFFGGWLSLLGTHFSVVSFCLGLKICFFVFLFVFVRSIVPRYRYDQLMRLGWKVFLPFSLAWLFFVGGLLLFGTWFPVLV